MQVKYVGGKATWDSLVAGSSVYSEASPNGRTEVQDVDGDGIADAWTLIQDSADFANLRTGLSPKRVIGIPKVASTLQHDRSGNYRDTLPFAVPYNKNIPRLHHMTTAALNVLKNNDDDQGFFLMVEGGAVDWAGHGNSLTRIIEEQTDFDAAVDSAIAWLAANGELENTLIIVTSDHETGYLTGPDFDTNNLNMPVQYAVADSGAGKMPGHKFMSNDAYGRGSENPSGEHTNQLVPLWANGPGAEHFSSYADAEDFVRGKYIDNTDLGHAMLDLWEKEQKPEPKNVILLISDGWSDNHMKAADYFAGETPDYQSWNHYYMSTHSASWDKNWEMTDTSYHSWYNPYLAWTQEDWIKRDGGAGATGSAAAATSMYTGYKTATYAVGVDLEGNALKTFCERASEIGKSTGVVSSVQFAHATPASMLAHNSSRGEYAAIANEMLLNSNAAVIMGCGAPDYDHNGQFIADETSRSYKYVGGKGTWNNLLDTLTIFDSISKGNNVVQDIDIDGNPDTWTLVRDSIDFVNLATGKTPLRVLGIPKVSATLQYNRDNNDTVAFGDPFIANISSLAEMTAGALNVLDNNSNGFALMVEGGAVDWAGHGNDLDGVIEEQTDFNNAVNAVIQWVNDSSNWDETMVIVTGDHETGYLVGTNWDPNNMPATYPLIDAGKGEMPGGKFLSGDHTNMLIPLFVKGVGDSVLGKYADHHDYYKGRYLDNTEIAQSIFKMWQETPDANPVIKPESVMLTDIKQPAYHAQINHTKIYPSITKGAFTIETQELPCLMKIYNMNGSVVLTGSIQNTNTQINLSNNPEGIYIVELMSQNNRTRSKLILQ